MIGPHSSIRNDDTYLNDIRFLKFLSWKLGNDWNYRYDFKVFDSIVEFFLIHKNVLYLSDMATQIQRSKIEHICRIWNNHRLGLSKYTF